MCSQFIRVRNALPVPDYFVRSVLGMQVMPASEKAVEQPLGQTTFKNGQAWRANYFVVFGQNERRLPVALFSRPGVATGLLIPERDKYLLNRHGELCLLGVNGVSVPSALIMLGKKRLRLGLNIDFHDPKKFKDFVDRPKPRLSAHHQENMAIFKVYDGFDEANPIPEVLINSALGLHLT